MLLANAMRLLQWAVGDIFITTNDINPETRFGGTWERFAKGKTLVGYDDSDTDFNEVNKTGGSKEHTHTFDHTHEVPGSAHSHTGVPGAINNGCIYVAEKGERVYRSFNVFNEMNYWRDGVGYDASTDNTTPNPVDTSSQSTNITGEATNVQPYITVYFWRKTA